MARKKKSRHEYRSKFEENLGARLDRERIPFDYEALCYTIQVAVPGGVCQKCFGKDIGRKTKYTPDWFFGRIEDDVAKGWVIESKGKFTGRDRKRVLALVTGFPELKFGMLFQRDNKLSKTSETRYSEWCEKHGIPWAVGWFKPEWLK